MDASPHIEVCVTQRFSASAERVFDAWLDPKRAGKWLFATAACPMSRVKIDARVGGSFSFVDRQGSEGVVHAGEYLDIVRPRRLVFALSMENSPKVVTRVIAEIAPLKQGCELTVTHEGVPLGVAARTEGRWSGMLYGLATILKSA
jgi:uncharacterized protein YndB with AHSA1/START domain